MLGLALAERGLLPLPVVRHGIRRLLRHRLAGEARRHRDPEAALKRFVAAMEDRAIAEVPELANAQHYEVPPAFFEAVLGRHLKYSCGLWSPGIRTLDEAEAAMLALTCERAGLADGQRILELGCGWGSLSLWMAERFPEARITAISNSAPQRQVILARARARGLANLEVLTADVNRFDPGARFDRVVSVEMFEHLRNWPEAFRRVAGWLEPEGRLFLHVFAHQRFAYLFEDDGDGDWMARHFFSGGIMPVQDLAARVGGPLEVEASWVVPGTHYARTAGAWLARLDADWPRAVDALAGERPRAWGERQAHRWRLFFLACQELFGFAGGAEWVVSHALLRPAGSRS
jgi:cyclopropane-fatty-acyl-phospholipid synthase